MLTFIVAMDQNQLIGYQNTLPWHLPADLKYFRAMTWGKPIIMGRKTYQSIGKPLPGRSNIVISRDRHLALAGCQVWHDLSAVVTHRDTATEYVVIGGATLYQQLFPYVQRLYVTWIHATFTGDTYFPIDLSNWPEATRQDYPVDKDNPYAYSFVTYHVIHRD